MQTQKNTRKLPVRRLITGICALLWAVMIFIFSAIPGASYPAHPGFLNYVAHFGEYAVLAALIATTLYGNRLKTWQVVLLSIIISSVYAASDELHQLFVPGRSSDPIDWLTDTLGATFGALLTVFVLRRIDKKELKG